MTSISDSAPPASNDRVQLTMLSGAAMFLRRYAKAHRVTSAETVRRALSLLAVVEEMSLAEHLAVVNEKERTVEAVEPSWRPSLTRRVPEFGGNGPPRRRAAR